MANFIDGKSGTRLLLSGNDAIARGALEAGIRVAAAYPGTPATEILEALSKSAKVHDLYVEWSANEKVAMEVAAAGSLTGLRSLTAMKHIGANVAADFMLSFTLCGTRGGMVLVLCDDPSAHSSGNEQESRLYAEMAEIPLLEPCDPQDAKDMVKYAAELSEDIRNMVMIRSVTRLSHTSGVVELGEILALDRVAEFKHDSPNPIDPDAGLVFPFPVPLKHDRVQKKLEKVQEQFETAPFNTYTGPQKPELLIITSSICTIYSREAVERLGLKDRVGVLKLGTTWPLPPKLLKTHMAMADRILVVEETRPVMEKNIKLLAMDLAGEIGSKTFHGKGDKLLPSVGEMDVELVTRALANLFEIDYAPPAPADYIKQAQDLVPEGAPIREMTFCPGCPHRASLFNIRHALKMDNRDGFACGDVGCYGMDILPTGFGVAKSLVVMGAGTGLASGFGKMDRFGMDQAVFSLCGDSTFFHAAMPALTNAIHNKSNMTMVVLDNSGTAMTGFQTHPGLRTDAYGNEVPALDIVAICKAMGVRVETCDPFDPEQTQKTLLDLADDKNGVKVAVMKQICALSPEKKNKKAFDVRVNESICVGANCGCDRLCTRILKCPGLFWDEDKANAQVDEAVCAGCGFCASICPHQAIEKQEVQ
ncbi:MAG: 4Fe-4S binding protein [Deltaproteobacteria bacterium]|nr:4Fe-4S binding protein [Deltaproteobacteria bacterium]